MAIGQDLLDVPMGEMIRSMATAIAEAQWELDKSSMTVAELMSGQRLLRDLNTGELINFSGERIQPVKDASGRVKRTKAGEPMYDPKNGPRMVDTRVFFGYTYEPERGDDGKIVEVDVNGEQVPRMVRVPMRASMMELGFTPNFYQFVDTIIEVRIAIRMTTSRESTVRRIDTSTTTNTSSTTTKTKGNTRSYGWSGWWSWGGNSANYGGTYSTTDEKKDTTEQTNYSRANVSTVDATYSNKYSYSAEGSSLLRTKMVPIPPPSLLAERIRKVMEAEEDYQKKVAAGQIGAVG